MSSQRPFFLSTFFAAFRQQPPAPLSSQTASSKQPSSATATTSAAAAARSISTAAATTTTTTSAVAAAAAAAANPTPGSQAPRQGGIASQLPLHSPRAVPIPGTSPPAGGRRRGSDSSSEGFREVRGADKWYIGGRTATGEERFFRLGVVRRVRSGDRLSLDRLSL